MRLIDAERFERRLMFTVDRDEICDDCLRSFLAEMSAEKTIYQVRHAHWIVERNPNGTIKNFYCSSCGPKVVQYVLGNYCPVCGARMDEQA